MPMLLLGARLLIIVFIWKMVSGSLSEQVKGVVNTFRGTGEIYVQSLNLQTFAGLLNRCLPKRS